LAERFQRGLNMPSRAFQRGLKRCLNTPRQHGCSRPLRCGPRKDWGTTENLSGSTQRIGNTAALAAFGDWFAAAWIAAARGSATLATVFPGYQLAAPLGASLANRDPQGEAAGVRGATIGRSDCQ